MDIIQLLESKEYRFAKTMLDIPHYYTLKKEWDNPIEFENTVLYIRKHGMKELWKDGQYYIYLYANGWKYWSMGSPVSETILINRAEDKVSV
ncbi:MAG: hypothetical protein VX762_01015 [Bacteroidota bacterium]|nr:hypothetical protein [Bacteroidota bacterium]